MTHGGAARHQATLVRRRDTAAVPLAPAVSISIAVHAPCPAERELVVDALRRVQARVLCHTGATALLAALAALAGAAPPDVIVTTLRDAAGRPTAPLVRRLRAEFPAVPVVAYGALGPGFAGDVVEAARAGIADVALRGENDLATVVLRAVTASRSTRVATIALGAVDRRLTPVTHPIVRHCLERAEAAPSVEDVARALGVGRKTVAARLAAEALPPASAIVNWGRFLHATRLLEDRGRPVERVAHALAFDSGTGLRHMLRRYTGLRTDDVRARGGLPGLLPLFAAALGAVERVPLDAAG